MIGNQLHISLYRYNPEEDKFPYMKKYKIDKPKKDIMVLDLLNLLKEEDQSISYTVLQRWYVGIQAAVALLKFLA